jgi:ribonuclease Z
VAKIIFLGTAAAVASRHRDNTSLLILEGKDKILVDCAGSPVTKLDKVKVDFRNIQNIFLTHTHPDHIYGIISLIHSRYILHDKINIYSHPKTLQTVKSLLNALKLNNTAKYPKIYFNPIEVSRYPFYNSQEIRSWVIPTKHSFESLGFKFIFKNKITCIFSSDTAFNLRILKYASTCDYLIHDCYAPSYVFKKYPQLTKMHTSSLKLGILAKEIKAKVLIPIHFATEINYSLTEIKKEIRMNFKGRIIIPRDLEILKLTHWPV